MSITFSLVKGDLAEVESPLVRVQTQSVLQDALGLEELGKIGQLKDHWNEYPKKKAGLFVLINHRDAKSYWLKQLLNEKVEVKRNRKVIGIGAQIIKAFGLSTIKFIEPKENIQVSLDLI